MPRMVLTFAVSTMRSNRPECSTEPDRIEHAKKEAVRFAGRDSIGPTTIAAGAGAPHISAAANTWARKSQWPSATLEGDVDGRRRYHDRNPDGHSGRHSRRAQRSPRRTRRGSRSNRAAAPSSHASTSSKRSEVSERRTFSVAVFCRNAGEVLLVRHKRLDLWLAVGGEVEAGETPLEAARRELREETGLEGVFPAGLGVDGTPPGLIGYEEHPAGSKGVHMKFAV